MEQLSAVHPSLERLRRLHPLGPGWNEPQVFIESVDLAGARVHLCGLVTQDQHTRQATGSAGALDEVPISRAYYELIERTSVLEAMVSGTQEYAVVDIEGRAVATAHSERVFPTTPDTAACVYSRSNGVAAGTSWREACLSAALELVERDRVLRSWYGELRPRAVSLRASMPPGSLLSTHDFEGCAFDEPEGSASAFVRGVFAFPRTATLPLSYGFAAAQSEPRALTGALRECLQRLAFLWGEPLPERPPAFARTAEYHQEVYLQPVMHDRIRAWLAGELPAATLEPCEAHCEFPNRFVDLTPATLAGRLWVIRALPGRELPLVFGRGHPRIRGVLPASLEIHPIA
jgi:hypothetical protein